MWYSLRLAAAAAACLALCSCKSVGEGFSGFGERSANRGHLKLLKHNMTKAEVLAVMGAPLTKEKYHQENVWFYYTDWQWADTNITSDECTPLVFENDKLAGWGHPYFKETKQRDWR